MDDAGSSRPERFSFAPHEAASGVGGSAAHLDETVLEVGRLLARAGVDHASAVWFQLMELATEQASEWSERALEDGPPLPAPLAARLGLRAVAGVILTAADDQDQDEVAQEITVAEACLLACIETGADAARAAPAAPLPRRWGEGAAPRPTARPRLIQRTAGCC